MSGQPQVPGGRRSAAVLTLCSLGVFVAQLDSTSVNLALPSISRAMGASTDQLQWVVDAYLLVLASLLMLSGSLGDRLGRRRVFAAGLALFGTGSVLCALSVNPTMLIAMRALEAIGGSTLAPVALAIVSNTFTDRGQRAQAIGVWGAVFGMGMALGPVIGGAVVHAFGWRAVFLVNPVLLLVAIPLVLKVVPESRSCGHRRIDVPGQLLAIALIASLTFAIIEGGARGFLARGVLVAAAAALVLLVAFLTVERRVHEPLLELRFFASVPFTMATVTALLLFFGYAGFLFIASLYLQDARGLNALDAGFAVLPLAVANVILAPLSGWAAARWGARGPIITGALALGAGSLILTVIDASTPIVWFLLAAFFVGSSIGAANAPVTSIAVSGMPLDYAGVAGATASTARQLGQSLGVAVFGALLNARLGAGLHFSAAALPGWWIAVATAATIVVLAIAAGTPRAQATAARVQAGFEQPQAPHLA